MAVSQLNVYLPVVTVNGIASFNNALAGKLNLTPSNIVDINGTINFIKFKYSSALTITSGFDISNVSFTITGINNGYTVVEIINGPNNNTVSTNNIFESITSITISGDINNLFTLGYGRDVVVFKDTELLDYSSGRPLFTSVFISPNIAANIAANNILVYLTSLEKPVLLLNNEFSVGQSATRPVHYRILTSAAITAVNAQAGVALPTSGNLQGLQYIFVAKNGILTTPSFYSVMSTPL